MIFLVTFLEMVFRILFYYSDSRFTFNGRSSESITPLTKLRYLGTMSSKVS